MMAGYRKGKTKVTTRAAKPSGLRLFQQPKAKRVYTKEILRQDPLDFANIGFGETGLLPGTNLSARRK